MPKFIGIALASLLLCVPMASLHAQDMSQQQMRSLDEQVQEVKSDVLTISAELTRLEEKLLYPSNTQLAIFVQLADDEAFRLDAVQIEINGELVAHYIYSFKELDALKNGGVQRVYTGNVPTGDHEIGVTVSGKLPNGKEYTDTRSFSFTKEIEPKLLGLTLAGNTSGHSGIELGDW